MLLKDMQISIFTFLREEPTPTDEELSHLFVEQIKQSLDYFLRENSVELFSAIGSHYLTETGQGLTIGELAQAFKEFNPGSDQPENPFNEQFSTQKEKPQITINSQACEQLTQKERLILNSLCFYIYEQLSLAAPQYLKDRPNLDRLIKSAFDSLTSYSNTDYLRILCCNFISSLEDDIAQAKNDSSLFKDLFKNNNTIDNNDVNIDIDIPNLIVSQKINRRKSPSKINLFIQLLILRLIAEFSFSTAVTGIGTLIGGILGTILFPGIGTIAGGAMGGALFGLASSQTCSWIRYRSFSILTQLSGIMSSAITLSIAGGLTGAIAGSIVPGLGTVAGAVVGSVGGFLAAVVPMVTISILSFISNKNTDLTLQRILYGSSYHRCRSRLVNTNFSPKRIETLNNHAPVPVVTIPQNSEYKENLNTPDQISALKSEKNDQHQRGLSFR